MKKFLLEKPQQLQNKYQKLEKSLLKNKLTILKKQTG